MTSGDQLEPFLLPNTAWWQPAAMPIGPVIDMIDERVHHLAGIHVPADCLPVHARLALWSNVLATVKIENIDATAQQISTYMSRRQVDPDDRCNVETIAALNAGRATMYAQMIAATEGPLALLEPENIQALHKITMQRLLPPALCGAFVTFDPAAIQTFTRKGHETVHVGTHPDHIEDQLADLRQRVSDPALHPITRALYSHLGFECIHPLEDGNGRVGRAILAGMLPDQYQLANPTTAFLRHKALYGTTLNAAHRSNDTERWHLFGAQASLEAIENSLDRIPQIVQHIDAISRRLRTQLSPAKARRVALVMASFPCMELKTLAALTDQPAERVPTLTRMLAPEGQITRNGTTWNTHVLQLASTTPETVRISAPSPATRQIRGPVAT